MKPNHWIPTSILFAVFFLRWQLLQLIAWTTMFVRYAWANGPADGWRMTFDGNHPCVICHAVASGSKAEAAILGTLAEFPTLLLLPTAAVLIGFSLLRNLRPIHA